MNSDKQQTKYLPMTETAYYILLSLLEPRHGYGIMQHVKKITDNRVCIGPGTIYGTLSKMEEDKLIETFAEEERRKTYQVTADGILLLQLEIARLQELLTNGKTELRCVE